MIQEGFELTLVGMAVVFAFLVLLVGFMTLSGAFFRKYSHWFPEPKAAPAPSPRKPADGSAKVAVAIAAAYRNRQ